MKLMIFDIGGTEVKYSVMDDTLAQTDAGKIPTVDDNYEAFLDRLADIYRPHADEVEGIAMSLPGFIDSNLGKQIGGGAIQCIIRRDIGSDLSEKCGCPVRIANDGKCAALAEQRSGVLKGYQNAGVFIIGTGVGGGLIINGKLLNGPHFTAGEYSFIRMNESGDWSDRRNTMGDTCSTRGLLLMYRKEKGLPEDAPIDGFTFFENVVKGEKEANDVLEHFCRNVAMAVQNLTFLLDLEKVAIGGGISKQSVLIEGIRRQIDELHKNSGKVFDPNMPKATVDVCRFGNDANQVGAFYLYQDAMA